MDAKNLYPDISNSHLNLNLLRENTKNSIYDSLNEITGEKCLFIDQNIMFYLEFLLDDDQFMKGIGVEKIANIGEKNISTDLKNIIFLLRPDLSQTKSLISTIKKYISEDKTIYLFYYPEYLLSCIDLLRNENIYNLISVSHINMNLFIVDDDLLSLEYDCFKQLYLDSDISPLNIIHNSIKNIDKLYGNITNIYANGLFSTKIYDMMMDDSQQININSTDNTIDTLILIDRECDYLSPLLTGSTYESLIDHKYQISQSRIKVSSKLVTSLGSSLIDSTHETLVNKPLNSSDSLYKEIRDLDIDDVPLYIESKSNELIELVDNKDTDVNKSKYITPLYYSILFNINVFHEIEKLYKNFIFKERLEFELRCLNGNPNLDKIFDDVKYQEDPINIINQLCILSLTTNGIKSEYLSNIKKEILQTYSFKYLRLFQNLDELGLLINKETINTFIQIKKYFQLINMPTKSNTTYISKLNNGYTPLTVRIIQYILSNKITDGIQLITTIYRYTPVILDTPSPTNHIVSNTKRKIALVYFIGGLSYSEINHLRRIGRNFDYDLIIMTTNMMSAKSLLLSCMGDN